MKCYSEHKRLYIIKKRIFIIYFSFVSGLLILAFFSFFYEKKLHDEIYVKYLPEVIIYPQYELKTGEITNKDEVTLWNISDFVPWYGIASYKICDFFQFFGLFLVSFAILLYLPVLLYNRKNVKIAYWIILAFEISLCIYFWFSLFD